MRCLFLSALAYILVVSVNAQQKLLPLNQQYTRWTDAYLTRIDTRVHSSVRPIIESDFHHDSLITSENLYLKRKERNKILGRKLKSEHLIAIDQDNFHFTIDPLVNFEFGTESSQQEDTTRLYKNMRGIIVQGDIGKHVSFSTSFYETQAFFPSYVDTYSRDINTDPLYPTYAIIPGQGRAKSFKNGGFDYGMSSANVSYSPNTYLNIQLGYGKNFMGEGYRSMLLSDVSFNYPFIKINAKFGKKKKWQYTNIFSSLKDIDRVPTTIATEQQFIPKAGTFHFLSWIPIKRIQIGLFEGSILQKWDSDSSVSTSFNPAQFNPVIGLNSSLYGLNSVNNSVMGLNIKITPINYVALYGQYLYDHKNRNGYQLGLKVHHLGGLIKNLSARIEYNSVMPYTFSHETPLQNYGHYGQPLAHIYGAGFSELISIVNYNFKDIFVQAKYISATSIEDKESQNTGSNIFKPTTNEPEMLISKEQHQLRYIDFQVGYMINSTYNLNVVVGSTIRTKQDNYSTYFYFALRTSLRNLYYDF